MTLRLTEWRGALPRAVLLAVVTSLIPLPAAAGETRPSPKPGAIKASVEKIAATSPEVARVSRASAARRAQSSSAQDASFFKTKPGIIILAVMVAGTGYALYSAKDDRINSPGKQ